MSQDEIKQLFELYSDDIFRFARTELGDHSEAKDVVQEVFIRAFRSWEGFRHESSPKTWLISIARNYILDLLRKKRTERKFIDSYEPPAVMDRSVSRETMMALEESIQQLKRNYREVFILRHIEQMSIHETAQVLGWSEGKVRTTDYRAIMKLREILLSESQEVKIHNGVRG